MAKRTVRGVSNINDLPVDVLSHIISFLPTRVAVRTSILSTRWKHLFTLLSNLDIKVGSYRWDENKSWYEFVDRLVFKREVPTIQRFRLNCVQPIDPHRVGIWICALVWHKIQELDFSAHKCPLFHDSSLSQSLFCCESLVVLKLKLDLDCKLKVLDRVYLPRLKVMHLESLEFTNDGYEKKLFSSCPVLEELTLCEIGFSKGLVKSSISNRNLKRLTLDYKCEVRRRLVDIMIDAPSLVHLTYNMISYCSLVFVDAKSPAEVVINWYKSHGNDGCIANLLKQIQNIKSLEVDGSMLWDLDKYHIPIPSFYKMTYLKIRNFYPWPKSLEYFLVRCVALETLVIEHEHNDHNKYSLQKSQLAPMLCCLRTIEVTLFDMVEDVEGFMEVIAFFLENAMVLEEVKIRCEKSGDPAKQVEIMRKLMSFPRGSSKCRLLG